jgi:hypothetical protein
VVRAAVEVTAVVRAAEAVMRSLAAVLMVVAAIMSSWRTSVGLVALGWTSRLSRRLSFAACV